MANSPAVSVAVSVPPRAGGAASAAAPTPLLDHMPNPLFATFTKSKNWAQRLVDELTDFIFVVSVHGAIIFTSASCQEMVGFTCDEMVGRPVSEFVHPDDAVRLSTMVQGAVQTNTPYHVVLRFRRKNADYVLLELNGRVMNGVSLPPAAARNGGLLSYAGTAPPSSAAATTNAATSTPNDPQFEAADVASRLVVNVARESPGKLAPFLDSVLDLRIEHARLLEHKRRLEMAIAAAGSGGASAAAPRSGLHQTLAPGSSDQNTMSSAAVSPLITMGMIAPAADGSGPDVHVSAETAWLPGRAGRSAVASPLSTSPVVTTTTVVSVSTSETAEKNKRRKRATKPLQERVCIDCGTTQSPEWRKGPTGAKTLCNACGLRYAKKLKTEQPGMPTAGATYAEAPSRSSGGAGYSQSGGSSAREPSSPSNTTPSRATDD